MKNILTIILLVLMSSFTYSQDKVINGKVTDEDNIPLIGVSIIVKGTNNGVYSDMDGEFRIQIKKPNAVLVFTSLGFKTVEKTIQGNNNLNVTMEADAQSLNEVVITGIRASHLAEVKAKREAATVIEAITPEDIGDFSDVNVADALQRVAGVQIQRGVDEQSGDRVSIRGIGPQFVGVTMNGRRPISAGNEGKSDFRKFNLNVIPSEIISGARIHKTAQANEVSTDIGGTVDFQTIRPLDAKYKNGKNYSASINYRSSSNSTIDDLDFGHRVSGVYTTKINDKLGVALSLILADENGVKDETNVRSFEAGLTLEDENGNVYENVKAPRTHNNIFVESNKERLATSAAIQWKPIEQLNFVFDYTRTDVKSDSDRQQTQINLGNINTGLLSGDHIFKEGDLEVLDINGTNIVTFISPSEQDVDDNDARTRITNTNQFYNTRATNNITGLQTTYKPSDKVKLVVDLSYSDLDYLQNLTQVSSRLNGRNDEHYTQTDLSIDLRGNLPVYGIPDELSDPSSFDLFRVNRRIINTKGYNYGAKFDVEYELNKDTKISFGARNTLTSFEARQTSSNNTDDAIIGGVYGGVVAALNASEVTEDNPDGVSAFSQLLRPTGPGFNGGNIGGLENGWIGIPGKAVLGFFSDGLSGLDGGSIFDFDIDLKDVDGDDGNLSFDARRSYLAEEESNDFYTQVDLKTELFEIPTAINFGVRGVNVRNKSGGFSAIEFEDAETEDTVVLVGSDARKYYEVETSRWDVLPSFNANLSLKRNIKLRLSAFRGVSRPRFTDLIPNNQITFIDPSSIQPADAADLANSGLSGDIRSGNPELKPYTSWSYDTTFEFYTNNGGAFIFSGFYKRVDNYIIRVTSLDQAYPGEELLGIALPAGLEELKFDITRPINISDGEIFGFEIGLNQHLSFLPGIGKGFGIKANYSYVESQFDEDLGEAANSFPGTAKHNANGTLYFEKSSFSVRLTAAYRGDYLSNLGNVIPGNTGATVADQPHFTEGTTVFGVNVRQSFLAKKLQLNLGVSNFTGEDVRRFQGNNRQDFSAYYNKEPVWKIGARYKF